MHLPICEVCAKTGLLCSSCEGRLSDGRITELDVELSRALFELGGDVGFERAVDTEDSVVVLTREEYLGRIIGRGGENIKKLSDKLGKQIKVVGTGELRDMVYDLVSPAQVLGVSRVYKPDGSHMQRIRVCKKDAEKLRMKIEDIQRIVASLTDEEVEITLE